MVATTMALDPPRPTDRGMVVSHSTASGGRCSVAGSSRCSVASAAVTRRSPPSWPQRAVSSASSASVVQLRVGPVTENRWASVARTVAASSGTTVDSTAPP